MGKRRTDAELVSVLTEAGGDIINSAKILGISDTAFSSLVYRRGLGDLIVKRSKTSEEIVREVMIEAKGDIDNAVEILGVHRTTLYSAIYRHNLKHLIVKKVEVEAEAEPIKISPEKVIAYLNEKESDELRLAIARTEREIMASIAHPGKRTNPVEARS